MSKIYFVMNDRADSSKGYKQVSEDYIKGYIDGFTDGRPYFINLGYAVMETDEENYRLFHKERARERYLEKLDNDNQLLSYNALDNEEFQGADVAIDCSEPFEDKVEKKLLLIKIPMILSMLTDSEKLLITQLYLKNMTEKMLATIYGVHQTTISRRKENILKKLKKYFEN